MHPSSPRHRLGSSPLIVLCLGALCCLLHAAPYQGESFTYRQPDGEAFSVKLFGDEFFAYEETQQGHLIVRDPKNGEFCYAEVVDNGTNIVSTGVRVGHPVPNGLKPKQRLTPAAVMAHSRVRREMFGVDDEGRVTGPLRDVIFRKRAKRAPDQQAGEADADISFAPAPDGQAMPAPDAASVQEAPLIPVTVNKRVGLVLMAFFPDRPGDKTKTREQIDTYCNARPGEATIDGNATSVYGYFYQQSNGRLEYNCVVTAWFQAANNRNYYTDNTVATGIRARELIHEGLAILDAQGF
ncbi:MAG TPA: hypothetical protein VFY13_09690, partial [Luteolibacter sp.]|nr:hypothetical protein [Luteolibacter sp.]